MTEPGLVVELLPAREGDCVLIAYMDGLRRRRILIDGGRKATYQEVLRRLDGLPRTDRVLDLVVVTHIDRDHIEGIVDLMKDPERPAISEIWFNGYSHTAGLVGERAAPDAEQLSRLIIDQKIPWNVAVDGYALALDTPEKLPSVTRPGGLVLTVLSPTITKLRKLAPRWARECEKAGLLPGVELERQRSAVSQQAASISVPDVEKLAERPFFPDDNIPNGSSIALLLEFRNRRLILAADAHDDALRHSVRALRHGGKPLQIDLLKVSHHGSARNLSKEFLAEIDCRNFAISSDGSHHGHPDAETIARIVTTRSGCCNIFFNYLSPVTEPWASRDLKHKYGYTVSFGAKGALAIPLRVEG